MGQWFEWPQSLFQMADFSTTDKFLMNKLMLYSKDLFCVLQWTHFTNISIRLPRDLRRYIRNRKKCKSYEMRGFTEPKGFDHISAELPRRTPWRLWPCVMGDRGTEKIFKTNLKFPLYGPRTGLLNNLEFYSSFNECFYQLNNKKT